MTSVARNLRRKSSTMILKVVAKSQAGLFPADRVRERGKEGRGRREGERGRRGGREEQEEIIWRG